MTRSLRVLIVLALLAAVAFPASAQQDAGPLAALLSRGANPNGPFAKKSMATTDSLVARARDQLGRRYRFASESPDKGFDCSGLVKYVLNAFGVDLPHNAASIARLGEPVAADTGALRPGDLLLFGRGRNTRISHVGIYIGNGKMIHASTSQKRVVETQVPSPTSLLQLRTVRRVLRDSTTGKHGSE
jgi:cell wall-associated NlpC family hydrolase